MKVCKHGHTTGSDKHGNCVGCNRTRCKKHHSQRRDEMAEYSRLYHRSRYANDAIYRAKIVARVRDAWRKKNGIQEPTRPAPIVCECCGRAPGKKALSLDHCHETGVFRGWLCGKCNTGIGSLGDTLDAIDRARDYLLRAKFT